MMKKVSILVPETAVPAAIVDPRYMFTAVNDFFKTAGHRPFFEVQTVGLTKEVRLNDGLICVHTDALVQDVGKTDLIIVPAISGDIDVAIERNSAFYPWIVEQYQKGVEVASLCSGAFLLASTGLLDGKSCSTHWLFANEFRARFPEIKLEDGRVITHQKGLYSSGGGSTYWNLLLYLVEKYTTREMAIVASKFFLLDIEKNSQLPFAVFRGQKDHGDELMLAIQEYIEQQYQNRLTVDALADKFGIGRRTFERRFKKVTANTVVEYIQRVKIEAAKKQLETGRKTVAEVMYDVGYTDPKAFRDIFKRIAGLSPVDYANRYN